LQTGEVKEKGDTLGKRRLGGGGGGVGQKVTRRNVQPTVLTEKQEGEDWSNTHKETV